MPRINETIGATPWQRHVGKWNDCQRCELCSSRKNVVHLRGKIPCDVLFIGEAPGASEDVIGKPFIGPAGRLLDTMIDRAGLNDGYRLAFANLVGCIPLGEDGTKAAEPSKEAIKACAPRLQEIVDLCKPTTIVLVGKLPAKHKPNSSAEFFEIVHPAAILRADVSIRGLTIQKTIAQLADIAIPF